MGHYWTEVAVRGVVIDPTTGDPAILLQDDAASAVVTVPSDPNAAESIICELEGIHRDSSLSLLYRFFVRHEVRINRLEIGRSAHEHLSAALCYRLDGHSYRMDVKPADGISLVVQAGAPMFVAADVINEHRITGNSPRVQENSDLLILGIDPDRRFAQK